MNKVESSALFDPTGKFLESEVEVKEAELPQALKATLAKDFAGYKLDEIAKVIGQEIILHKSRYNNKI